MSLLLRCSDETKRWLVCLVPRWLCAWLFDNVSLGSWTPFIFGRVIGSDAHRAKPSFVAELRARPTARDGHFDDDDTLPEDAAARLAIEHDTPKGASVDWTPPRKEPSQ